MILKFFVRSALLGLVCVFLNSHKINELLVERLDIDEIRQTKCLRCNISLNIEFDKDDHDFYWILENCLVCGESLTKEDTMDIHEWCVL